MEDAVGLAAVAVDGSFAPREPARQRVALLGGFGLTVDGRAVTVPVSTQRIISVLALRGRSGRSRLAGSLWPETTEPRALASLRTAIWRANLLAPGLVVSAHDSIDLAEEVEVDVTRLVRIAHEVLDGHLAVMPGARGFRPVDGDLLPDWHDDWLVVDRERLRQLRLHVLEAMAAQLATQGMFGLAMEAALAALHADVLRESAHRAVIRIHLAEGNLAEARSAYANCCAVLDHEVGMSPSAETQRLSDSWSEPSRRPRVVPEQAPYPRG
ncbi:MAG: AfsR/SARP family transcriptional regulator [Cellulomonas sp.]